MEKDERIGFLEGMIKKGRLVCLKAATEAADKGINETEYQPYITAVCAVRDYQDQLIELTKVTGTVILLPNNLGTWEAGDAIMSKSSTGHIQFLDEYSLEHMDKDKMLKEWDRVIPYLVSYDFDKGDVVYMYDGQQRISTVMGTESIATEDMVKYGSNLYFKILGKTSKAVVRWIKRGMFHNNTTVDAIPQPLRECSIPGHENDITGHWYETKCPCCEEYK